MPRQIDHVLGRAAGVVGAAQLQQRAHQPFVVVCIEMHLVGDHAVVDHPRVFGADRGLQLPGRLGIRQQRIVNVRRHVPHVADRRRRGPAFGRGVERRASVFVEAAM